MVEGSFRFRVRYENIDRPDRAIIKDFSLNDLTLVKECFDKFALDVIRMESFRNGIDKGVAEDK